MAGDSYRLPIALLVFVGFLVGLIASFWFAGMFGVAPSLLWPSVVLAFLGGIFFLQHPKLYLAFTFAYYGFFLNGVLFGVYYVPFPMARIFDELLLAIPLAIIVMKSINRSLPRGATMFPFFYISLAILSYKVNHVPLIDAFRITLSFFKFYIYWYFARAIGPWSQKEKKRWFVALVAFAAFQFVMDIIWQRNIVPTTHPDNSVGSVGNAHFVGYLSSFALFYMAGWFLARQKPYRLSGTILACGTVLILAYNLIFMTDTKHALIFLPVAGLPFLFYRGLGPRTRFAIVAVASVFMLASWLYITTNPFSQRIGVIEYGKAIARSGKGFVFHVTFQVLPREVPFYPLGAGPGNFCSTAAVYAFRPLAVKYVVPFIITAMRSRGAAAEASVLGSPSSALLVLFGEFGLLSALAYIGFWLWVARTLWRRGVKTHPATFDSGQALALSGCVIFMLLLGSLSEMFAYGIIMMPVWTLIGMHWDQPAPAKKVEPPSFNKSLRRVTAG
jgi:hypothetical protein